MFHVSVIPGLSNYLSGIDTEGRVENNDIFKYIKKTEVENLYVIPAGNVPPNPSELLATETMVNMLEKLKEFFDIIILDATPSLLVTDAIILSRIVDSTVIVAAHKLTKKDNLEKIKKSIENVGGKIAGVVINKIPVNIQKYKSTYYYSSSSANSSRTKINKEFKPNRIDDVTKEKSDEIMKQLDEYLNKKMR